MPFSLLVILRAASFPCPHPRPDCGEPDRGALVPQQVDVVAPVRVGKVALRPLPVGRLVQAVHDVVQQAVAEQVRVRALVIVVPCKMMIGHVLVIKVNTFYSSTAEHGAGDIWLFH